jgi:hypothetical protein
VILKHSHALWPIFCDSGLSWCSGQLHSMFSVTNLLLLQNDDKLVYYLSSNTSKVIPWTVLLIILSSFHIFCSRGDWAFQSYRRLCSILKIRTNAGKHIPFSAVERLTNDLSWKNSMRAGRALSNGIVMFWRAGFRCWSELITVRKILTSSCRWGCDFECECETLWDCNCCKQAHVNPPLWIDREIASEISRQCWKHFFMGFSCRLTILEVAVDSS